jgi:hypothetical protein
MPAKAAAARIRMARAFERLAAATVLGPPAALRRKNVPAAPAQPGKRLGVVNAFVVLLVVFIVL